MTRKKLFTKALLITVISLNLTLAVSVSFPVTGMCAQTAPEITAGAAVVIEGSTGAIIYEKNKDTEVVPASITKIMTLILIFEAVDSGKITLDDSVTVSEHAASMGGSQVFLEPGETQTVDTMIKCISVASANDACASYI